MSARDRVSTAAEATAASVREIRPLALPDASEFSAEPRDHQDRTVSRVSKTFGRVKETWMVPVGAAAAVTALAVSLVALRHAEPPRPAPANGSSTAGAAGIPRYYAIATEGKVSHDQMASIAVTVGDIRTGATLATVALPAISTLVGWNAVSGVSATGDDRAFVIGRRDTWGDVDYFLVRIAPGTKHVATVEHLPIPETSPGALLGFAVSPDGKQLAALSVRGNGTTLRIYSVTSGATLRSWTAATWHKQGNGALLQPGVSWTADNRQVAFSTVVSTSGNQYGVLAERVIGATQPSGDLASASRVVLKAPGNCTSLLLTPDGGTVVCATQVNYLQTSSPSRCGKDGPAFVAYSATTGKRLRVLYKYTGTCRWSLDTVLWSDASARHVIGESWTEFQGSPTRITDRYGVAAAGKFVKFPVAKHGQWYGGPAF